MSSVTLSEEFVNNSIRFRNFIYNFINSGRKSLYPEHFFTFHFVEIAFSISESMINDIGVLSIKNMFNGQNDK